jgi:hypothetical protein
MRGVLEQVLRSVRLDQGEVDIKMEEIEVEDHRDLCV